MSGINIFHFIILIVLAGALGAVWYFFKKEKLAKRTAAVIAAASAALCVIAFISSFFVEKPQLTLLGEEEMVIPVFAEYTDEGATATLGDKDYSDKIKVSGEVNPSVVGEYKITYDFSLRGSFHRVTRLVKVSDSIAPTLTLTGDAAMTVSSMKNYAEPGFTATDNYDGDITANVKTEQSDIVEGVVTIRYTVTDSSGNKAELTRTVTVSDIVKPTIKLSAGPFISVQKGGSFTMPTATATDDVDGDLTAKISRSGSVDTSVSGVHTVTYTVKDSSGNTATYTLKVNVYIPDDPSLSRIYLTFDDGPSSKITIRVLDILKANGIQATFFINGYSADKVPTLNRMVSEGHTIAVHGNSHDYDTIYKSTDACVNNFLTLHDKILADTGYDTKFFRFPGGSSNTVSKDLCTGVVTNTAARMTSLGWRYFDWNVSSGDAASKPATATEIYNMVIGGLKKGRANIVLMHDTNAKVSTADSLQSIINYGKNNGYVFCAINETTPDYTHKIAN